MATLEQKLLLYDKIGRTPTESQRLIHTDNSRVKLVAGGWRAGKSDVGAAELFGQFFEGDLFWILGIDYELCRPEFGYLVDWFKKLGVLESSKIHFPSKDQCSMEVEPGIVIETKSGKYPEKIAAKAPKGILMVEAAQLPTDIFWRALGRLVEKDGWLVMTGTLESSLDWYADKYREYQMPDNVDGGKSFSLPSWTNKGYKGAPFTGRDDPKLLQQEKALGHDLFMERYGGMPIRPKGLAFPEFRVKLHTGRVPYDPALPVHIGIDPGYDPSAYTVEMLQFANDEIRVFDEIYVWQKIHEEVIRILQRKPYYDKIEGGAIDIAASRHISGRPEADVWREKTGIRLNTNSVPVDGGVTRLRTFLLPHPISGEVGLHIDSHCQGIISEFGGCKSPLENETGVARGPWKRKTDSKGNVISDDYEKRFSDGIKALIYAVVARYGLAVKPKKPSYSGGIL